MHECRIACMSILQYKINTPNQNPITQKFESTVSLSIQQKEKSITEEKIFQITIYKYFFGLHHSMKGYKIYQCKKDWDDAIVCINEFVGEPFSSTINNAIHIVKTINSATYNSIGGINDGGFSKIYKSEETMEKTNTSEFFGYSQNIVTEKFTSKRCIQISNPLQN